MIEQDHNSPPPSSSYGYNHGFHVQVEGPVPYVCHYLNRINSRGIWFRDDPLADSVPCLLSLISIITRSIHLLLKPFGEPLIVSQILDVSPRCLLSCSHHELQRHC